MLVTEAEPVYITGAVLSPGGIYLRDQLMLSRALAMVGGARKEAKLNDVRIYRQVPGSRIRKSYTSTLAAIKKNQKPDFLLQAYDVIEVSEAGMFSASRIGSNSLCFDRRLNRRDYKHGNILAQPSNLLRKELENESKNISR